MSALFRRIAEVGGAEGPVLITGESGTGKELVARALHAESPRHGALLTALNCSALPADQLERELFGPGLGAARGGLFRAAGGGTLFLDGIGDLGLAAQGTLLERLAAAGERRPRGAVTRALGTRALGGGRVDVRVIAATSRPLAELVADGRCRADLGEQLSATVLTLPPLRERKADLPLLSGHFLRDIAERRGAALCGVSDEAWALLERYDWPGNVRELRSVLEGAVAMSDGIAIRPGDLPGSLTRTPAAVPRAVLDPDVDLPFVTARELALREFDRAFLSAALVRHGGNIARTARALGLHRQSLQKLLARRDLRHV